MRFLHFAFATLLALAVQAGSVIELSKKNFDHDTQIGSGMTTGPWFIKFYAPWCGHCKKLAPAWDELSDALKGEVNVAKVDCTKDTELRDRFDVHGYPTLLFFKDNRMYKYTGARDVEKLKKFALNDYAEALQKDVPPPSTFFSRLRAAGNKYVSDIGYIWGYRTIAGLSLLLTGTMLGLAIGLGIGLRSLDNSPKKTKSKAKPAADKKSD